MIKKLRLKFVIINMSIVTIMLCVILGLVFYFTRADLESESIRMMQSIASQPFQYRIPIEPGEDVRLPYFTVQLGLWGEPVAVNGGYYDLPDNAFFEGLVAAALASPQAFGVIEDYNLRYYRVDAPQSSFVVFADISSEQATLDHLMQTCFLIGGLSFLLFLGASILLSKWAVRPVELAWRQQRQFVADASHELKTPLTVIITNAELAQGSGYDEESRQRFLSSISVMSRKMRGLVEQLLELAKADSGLGAENLAAVDFSRLVSDGLLPFEPVFFERGLTLTAQIEENITVPGEEAQLCRVLDILLDNAQKYSNEAAVTHVILKKRGKGRCLLTVANQGKELSPGEARNIFKRFYRIDQARSHTDSFGLGLSIAESIVSRHRGKIWAESNEGVNCFYVELPCS